MVWPEGEREGRRERGSRRHEGQIDSFAQGQADRHARRSYPTPACFSVGHGLALQERCHCHPTNSKAKFQIPRPPLRLEMGFEVNKGNPEAASFSLNLNGTGKREARGFTRPFRLLKFHNLSPRSFTLE